MALFKMYFTWTLQHAASLWTWATADRIASPNTNLECLIRAKRMVLISVIIEHTDAHKAATILRSCCQHAAGDSSMKSADRQRLGKRQGVVGGVFISKTFSCGVAVLLQ